MTNQRPEKQGITLKQLAEQVGGTVVGDPNLRIQGVAGIGEAHHGDITFVMNPRYLSALDTTSASAVIVSKPLKGHQKSWLVVQDPYYAFSQIVTYLYQKPYQAIGVSHLASIAKDVKLGADLSIHPFVRIDRSAIVGNRVTLYPGVYIGEKSRIGDDSILYSNVSVRENVDIGCRVIIHSGSVLGSDGFGFATHVGRHYKIPQIGTVVIGDDVEIGANVAIDRAALGRTVIGRGTKIDNLVQIAHNVNVGEHSLLVSQVGISGSTCLGNQVVLAGQVGVAGHLTVGDNVMVGAKSGVMRDIPHNDRVSGIPAMAHRTWLGVQASLPYLPQIRKRLKALEEQVENYGQMARIRKKKSRKRGDER